MHTLLVLHLENLENDSWVITTLQFTNQKLVDSFELCKVSNFESKAIILKAIIGHHCARCNFCFSSDMDDGKCLTKYNDLTFISTVAEPVSRDCELHSLVSPRNNWCISRCHTDRRSFPSGLFLSAKHGYPKLVQHSGLVSFTIELQARFTYERHVTPLRSSDMTSWLFSNVAASNTT